jgi:hypothetical protein
VHCERGRRDLSVFLVQKSYFEDLGRNEGGKQLEEVVAGCKKEGTSGRYDPEKKRAKVEKEGAIQGRNQDTHGLCGIRVVHTPTAVFGSFGILLLTIVQ